MTFIISLILLLVIEIFMPSLCLGAIIGLAAKSQRKEEMKGGLVLALYNFMPLFILKEIFILSRFMTVVTFASLILRYAGDDGFQYLFLGALTFFWIFSVILKFLASFTEEGIVIRKQGIFEAMGRSFKLIISHLRHIVFILILLFVITLRILFNLAIVLVLPAIIMGFSFLFSLILPPVATWIVSSIIGFILVLIATYFITYLHVFKQTVWTLTYLELSSQKDLDVIEES